MFEIKTKRIRTYEKGLLFRNGEFRRLLGPGRHWVASLFGRVSIQTVSTRAAWFVHRDLDTIVKSGALEGEALVVDLKDSERALVWIDGRFDRIVAGGLYALWTGFRKVEVQIVDARAVRFGHDAFEAIIESPGSAEMLEVCRVPEEHVGVLYCNGAYVETLKSGRYAFWRKVKTTKVCVVDMREASLDIAGQEIMTADKVSLRVNALVAFRVVDARKTVSASEDARQALYRRAQLALRTIIGTRELDALLADKDATGREMTAAITSEAIQLGIEIVSVGIRDIILPGDMKELMNKVTEARKAAEANLIYRREETAAMRSQANTARVLEGNPVLMRLRELEVLEKVAGNSKLNVVLGEKGLADRIVNLL